MKGRNRKCLVHLNPCQTKTTTPRLCTIWPALRGCSLRSETVSTCLLIHLISGEEPDSKLWTSSNLYDLGICLRLITLFCLRSVWSQQVQWSVPIGRKMWMRSCIQNITGSHQTTSRGQTWMLPSLSASGASRRSSVTGVATGSLTPQRSNCDSTSSTGKTTLEWLVTGLNPERQQFICKELTGFCLIYQAWEHSQRCQSQLPYRHQSALLEWWRSHRWHVWGARTLSSRVCRRLEWISPGLFQWWTRPLLFPGGTVVILIQNFRLASWYF